jgi:hypothetical protein
VEWVLFEVADLFIQHETTLEFKTPNGCGRKMLHVWGRLCTGTVLQAAAVPSAIDQVWLNGFGLKTIRHNLFQHTEHSLQTCE